MNNFWNKLPLPFVGLAPMDGVTDQPFRFIVQKYGNPDVIFTEFVNVEGLCHNARRLLTPLIYDDSQQPIVAQIYGKTPEYFRQAAILVAQLGFAGVDINMGCPSKSVAGGGAGAGLIKTPDLALEIIKAVNQGVEDWTNGATIQDCPDFKPGFCRVVQELHLSSTNTKHQPIPVSVKTRLGYDEPQLEDWISLLLQQKISALTIHGRTLKQGYSGKADWKEVGKVAELCQSINPKIKIIGNGDVQNRSSGEKLAKEYNLAGVLIGRAAQGNPFVFDSEKNFANLTPQQQAKKLAQVALEHAQVFEKTFVEKGKNKFLPMRKHLAWYMKGMPGAKVIRKKLIRANSSEEVKQVLYQYRLF